MAKSYELIIYHCYKCGEFRVKVPSGKSKLLEPCQKCKTPCVRAMPFALDIEFTNRCSGMCKVCPRGRADFGRKIGDMADGTFTHLVKEISNWNRKQPYTVRFCFLHLFGESIGHPRFVEWTNKLAAPLNEDGAAITTLVVSTNGMPLSEWLINDILASRLHRLIVSLDGVSKETSKKIRPGVNFDRVQRNVDTLLKLARARSALGRRVPSIWIQILKLNENEGEWLAYARKYTENPRIKRITPKGRQYRDIPGVPGGKVFFKSVERMAKLDELEQHKGWDGHKRRRFTCKKPWERASIWWDGSIPSPACCYTAESDTIFGTLADGKNSLHGVWLGPAFQHVREQFAKYQNSDGKSGILPKLCRNC